MTSGALPAAGLPCVLGPPQVSPALLGAADTAVLSRCTNLAFLLFALSSHPASNISAARPGGQTGLKEQLGGWNCAVLHNSNPASLPEVLLSLCLLLGGGPEGEALQHPSCRPPG